MNNESKWSPEVMAANEEQKMYKRQIQEIPGFQAAVRETMGKGVEEDIARQTQMDALQITPRKSGPLEKMIAKSLEEGLEQRSGNGRDQFLAGYEDFRAGNGVRKKLVDIRDGRLNPRELDDGWVDAVDGIIQRDLDDLSVHGETLVSDVRLIVAVGNKVGVDLLAHTREKIRAFLAEEESGAISLEGKSSTGNFEKDLGALLQ